MGGGGEEGVRDDGLPGQHGGRVVGGARQTGPEVVLQELLVQAQSLGGGRRGVDGGPPGLLGRGHAGAVRPHAHGQALLEAAILTPVPGVLRDLALLVAAALVAQLLPDRPLEESLASLAADGSVMPT